MLEKILDQLIGRQNTRKSGKFGKPGFAAVQFGLSVLILSSVLAAGCAKPEKTDSGTIGEIKNENGADGEESKEPGEETREPGEETKETGEETRETGEETKKPGEVAGNTAGTAENSGGETEEFGGELFVRTNETVYVTANKLNLREEPSLQGNVLRQADTGEEFTRTGRGDGEWDRITDVDGTVYYAAKEYLSRYNPLTAAAFSYQMSDLGVVDVSGQNYTYEEMCEDLGELAERYPDHVKLSSLGTTRDGRELYLARLGSPDAEDAVIIQAAIHAREYMTVLIAMKQLEYYLEYYDSGYYKGIPYAEIFDKTAVYLIPMMNPDGVAISQSGLDQIRSEEVKNDIREWYDRDKADAKTGYSFEDYMKYFKANSYGVDLNRNFDMGWKEFGGSRAPGAEKYKGTAPGSEPESAALIKLTEELEPRAAVSYHASGSVLYWDYGQNGDFRKECENLTRVIAGLTGYQMMYRGSDGGVDAAGYSDWAAGVKEIPAVTIEIGTGKAPLGIGEFQSIWDKNREVMAAVCAQYLEE